MSMYSLVTAMEFRRWFERNLPTLSKGEIFEKLREIDPMIQFDYALPEVWLDQLVKKTGINGELVLRTTVWVYRRGSEGPVSCCKEVQYELERCYYNG